MARVHRLTFSCRSASTRSRRCRRADKTAPTTMSASGSPKVTSQNNSSPLPASGGQGHHESREATATIARSTHPPFHGSMFAVCYKLRIIVDSQEPMQLCRTALASSGFRRRSSRSTFPSKSQRDGHGKCRRRRLDHPSHASSHGVARMRLTAAPSSYGWSGPQIPDPQRSGGQVKEVHDARRHATLDSRSVLHRRAFHYSSNRPHAGRP